MVKPRIETLDHAYLKERLRYDLLTGVFTWKKHPSMSASWNAKWAGKEAGCVAIRKDGYKRTVIRLDGELYLASRLAWFYVLKRWPDDQIDHINHDSLDNHWANLREVSSAENSRNLSKCKNNTSGVMGVSWFKRYSKWMVYIKNNGTRIFGGYFDSFEEACARRKELEKTYGFHENHGQ
jgi:hypothetical protein